MQEQTGKQNFRFGLFEADLEGEQLSKEGKPVKLQSQPFKVLTVLLQNAGKLVTREQLQERVWGSSGTTVGFDHSLSIAIAKIRDVLGDPAENPVFIQTISKKGYRFVAPVHSVPDSHPNVVELGAPVARPSADPLQIGAARDGELSSKLHTASRIDYAPIEVHEAPAIGRHEGGWSTGPKEMVAVLSPPFRLSGLTWRVSSIAAVLVTGAGLIATGWWMHGDRRPSPPRISQLTHEGNLSGKEILDMFPAVATDGVRIFAQVMELGQSSIVSMPVAGGPSIRLNIPVDVQNPILSDISPDGSALLVRSRLTAEAEEQLWSVSTVDGSAVQVGHIRGHAAIWRPNGDILYAYGNNLYTLRSTGGNPTLLASLSGMGFWPRWNPVGNLLRFTINDPVTHTFSLWQLSVSDPTPRPVLTHFHEASNVCCGMWTADGSSFIFRAERNGNLDLWRLPADQTENPTQLTNGPLQYQSPAAAKTGNLVFFVGVDWHSQIEKVQPNGTLTIEKDFLSDADKVDFSRDHKWVAWTEAGKLWRATANGQERVQLTSDPLSVYLAKWSPDGSKIALMAHEGSHVWSIYLMPANGGSPQLIAKQKHNAADPSWSADGLSIVFGGVNDPLGRESGEQALKIFDIRTGSMTEVPGSTGLFSPRWSPNGKFIAALSLDQRQVKLFNVAAQTWMTLAVASGCDPFWSSDSSTLFVQGCLESDEPLHSISSKDFSVTQVAVLPKDKGIVSFNFIGLALDGSPLLRAFTSTGNLYSEEVR